jgi:methylated-DNA-[protein]-cysteine S-methyltransferase
MTARTTYTTIPSPVGELVLVGRDGVLTALEPASGEGALRIGETWVRDDAAFPEARAQLEAYFDGGLREFELPLAPEGTPFEQRVWAALREIPYGATTSYGQVAAHIGVPNAARAVGAAVGRNPLMLLVPCHRVVGADGSLTGFRAGLDRKRRLLAHEAGTPTKAV